MSAGCATTRASATSSTGSSRTASTRSGSRERVGGDAPDPVIGLAVAAGRTRSLKLGTSVQVLPGRNPALLAKEWASLDRLSGGRALPAFGLGNPLAAEHQAFGVTREERAPIFDEALPLIRRLWREDAVDHDGAHFSYRGLTVRPKPLQDDIDVWLGGRAKSELRRCGRLGDGWLASFLHRGGVRRRVARSSRRPPRKPGARSTTSTTARWCCTPRGRPRRGPRAPGRAPAGERPGRPRRSRAGPPARPTRRLRRRRLLEAGRRTARRAHVGRRHDGELGSRSGRSPRRCSTFRPERGAAASSCSARATSGERARLTVATAITTHGHDGGRDRDGAGRAERLTEERHADQRSDDRVGHGHRRQRRGEVPGLERALVEHEPDEACREQGVRLPVREDVDHAVVEQVERRLRERGREPVHAPGARTRAGAPAGRATRRAPRSRRSRSGPRGRPS